MHASWRLAGIFYRTRNIPSVDPHNPQLANKGYIGQAAVEIPRPAKIHCSVHYCSPMSTPTYSGPEVIAIAMDLGTTMSTSPSNELERERLTKVTGAVSFAHLVDGQTPAVRMVTRWPGQEDYAGDCKVPSVVRYQNGTPIAYGMEALENPGGVEGSELAKWYPTCPPRRISRLLGSNYISIPLQ